MSIIILILVILGLMYFSKKPDTTNVQNNDGMETCVNSEYGFKISYPEELIPEPQFASFYLLSPHWRVYAPEESRGVSVISIPVYRIDQGGIATGKSYPLFFSTEVRVGVSTDSNDVASYFVPDLGYMDQVVRDEVIHGIPFKVFSFGEGAMMKYIQGESYRTVHNNTCFALERIKTGSNYRDETMAEEIPEAELDGYYNQTRSIVETFEFIN